MAKDFIADAIRRPGALTKKAKSAGESPLGFAKSHDKGGSKTAQQSRFAEFLNKVRPGGKGKPKPKAARQADALEKGR